MKRFLGGCICVLWMLGGFAEAITLPFDLLEKEYSIAGSYDCWVGGENWADNFAVADVVPLEREISWTGDGYLGLAYSRAGHTDTSLDIHVSATNTASDGGEAVSSAQGEWTFRPYETQMTIKLEFWSNLAPEVSLQGAYIKLMDLTTGTLLLDEAYGGAAMGEWHELTTQNLHVGLNLNHDYGLLLAAAISASNNDSNQYIDVSASFLPEPTTVMLLGFGSLMLLRKVKKK